MGESLQLRVVHHNPYRRGLFGRLRDAWRPPPRVRDDSIPQFLWSTRRSPDDDVTRIRHPTTEALKVALAEEGSLSRQAERRVHEWLWQTFNEARRTIGALAPPAIGQLAWHLERIVALHDAGTIRSEVYAAYCDWCRAAEALRELGRFD